MLHTLPKGAWRWLVGVCALIVLALAGCTADHPAGIKGLTSAPSTSPAAVRFFQSAQPSGTITWDFTQVPPGALATVKEVTASSEKFFRLQFGAPWHSQRISIMQYIPEGPDDDTGGDYYPTATGCQQTPSETSIRLASFEVHELQRTLPHEIAHAFIGCAIDTGRFPEAQAEAFAQIYRHAADPSEILPEYIGLNQADYRQANRPGIGVPAGPFQDLRSLNEFRYTMLASALRLYNQMHPGFLKRQYLTLYQETRRLEAEGGFAHIFTMDDPLKVTSRMDPAFAAWLRGQHIFDEPPKHNVVMTFALQNGIGIAAIKYNGWKQQAWVGLHVTATVKGLPDFTFSCVTNQYGTCPQVSREISLNWVMQLYPKKLKFATIVVTGGGLTDTHTYPILEP